jgi:hypothetical protein
MRQLILIIILLLVAQRFILAQDKNINMGLQRKIDNLMKEQIIKLKSGVLLIRLKSKDVPIAALKQINQPEKAEKLKAKQFKLNSEIVAAFRKNFTFCPAYFFYDTYNDTILAGHIDDIIFLNDSLIPDPTIKLSTNKFLVAEFGFVVQDTAKYYTGSYYHQTDSGKVRKSEYSGGMDVRFEALRIMSDELVQLQRPFPYYVRTLSSLPPLHRKPADVVLKMNDLLFEYYELNK